MTARVRLAHGNDVYIDTDDLDRARQRGRKLIPIRHRKGRRQPLHGEGDLLLLIDNMVDGDGRNGNTALSTESTQRIEKAFGVKDTGAR